jgi:hypothetical protein
MYEKKYKTTTPIQIEETKEETKLDTVENKEVNFNLDDVSCAFIWIRNIDNTSVLKVLFAWDLATHDNEIVKMFEEEVPKYFQTEGATGDVIISTTDFFNKYKEVWNEETTTSKFKSIIPDITAYTYPMQISDNGYILGSHATGGFSEEEIKVTEVSRNYLTTDKMLIKISVEYIDEYEGYTDDTYVYYDATIKINDDGTYSFINIDQN